MTIQVRRGTTAEWTAADPVLAAGEPGLDLDTGTVKFGDGVSAWSALSPPPGGGGGATSLHTPPATPDAMDDEFDGTSGLDSKWTRHNLTGQWVQDGGIASWGMFDVAASQPTDVAIYQPLPSGDFEFACCATAFNLPGRQMWGLFIVDDSGNGPVVNTDNGDVNNVRGLTAWSQGGGPSGSGAPADTKTFYGGSRTIFQVKRVGTNYEWSITGSDFLPHSMRAKKLATIATAYTRIGFGRIYTDNGGATQIGVDYFRRLS